MSLEQNNQSARVFSVKGWMVVIVAVVLVTAALYALNFSGSQVKTDIITQAQFARCTNGQLELSSDGGATWISGGSSCTTDANIGISVGQSCGRGDERGLFNEPQVAMCAACGSLGFVICGDETESGFDVNNPATWNDTVRASSVCDANACGGSSSGGSSGGGAPVDAASCTFATPPPSTLTVGQSFSAVANLQNTGDTPWFTANNLYSFYNLSYQTTNHLWTSGDRYLLQNGPVGPGGSTTINMTNMTAPATPGTYTLDFQMLHENVAWFGQHCQQTITVTAAGPQCTLQSAVITANPESGQAPLAVSFIGSVLAQNCTGNFDYAWDFTNDGTVDSSLQTPSFTYPTAGTYTVKLTVSKNGQSVSNTKVITVTAAPSCSLTANASGTPASGQAPLAVSFTGSATAQNCTGTPSYSWNFGDGRTSSQQNPSHTYTTAGSYNAVLTVTQGGQTATKTVSTIVTQAQQYSITLSANATNLPANTPVTLQAAPNVCPPPAPYTVIINIDGVVTQLSTVAGCPSTTATYNPGLAGTHSFQAKIARVDGTDVQAVSNTVTVTWTAGPQCTLQSAVITANPESGQAPLAVSFIGSVLAQNCTGNFDYAWDFTNDGTVDSSLMSPSFTYPTAGTYTVKLTVSKNGQSVSTTKLITVTAGTPPTGSFTINNNAAFTTTTAVTLNNSVTGATEMRFQDVGAFSAWEPYAATRPFTLLTPDGTKTVNGEFRNAAGAVLSLNDSILLDTTDPWVTASPTPPATAVNQNIVVTLDAFDASSGSGLDASNIKWHVYATDGTDTGNAGSFTLSDAMHGVARVTINTIGVYRIHYFVKDLAGNLAEGDFQPYTVPAANGNGNVNANNQPPTVQVTANPASGTAPLTSLITASATDPDGDSLSYTFRINNALYFFDASNHLIAGDAYDYDNNGYFDIADTTVLENVLVGNTTCPAGKVCDVNNDGQVNLLDITVFNGRMVSSAFNHVFSTVGTYIVQVAATDFKNSTKTVYHHVSAQTTVTVTSPAGNGNQNTNGNQNINSNGNGNTNSSCVNGNNNVNSPNPLVTNSVTATVSPFSKDVFLRWDPIVNQNVTQFKVYRASCSGGIPCNGITFTPSDLIGTTNGAVVFLDITATPGSSVAYGVSAVIGGVERPTRTSNCATVGTPGAGTISANILILPYNTFNIPALSVSGIGNNVTWSVSTAPTGLLTINASTGQLTIPSTAPEVGGIGFVVARSTTDPTQYASQIVIVWKRGDTDGDFLTNARDQNNVAVGWTH